MNTIISKRPSPFIYTKWSRINGAFTAEYSILINGGAGVMGGTDLLSGKKQDNFSMIIPEGVATIVDNDTLEKLMAVDHFVRDLDRGIVKVIKGKSIKDQERIDSLATNKDMVGKEEIKGRQITEDDMKDAGAIKQDDGSWNVAKSNTVNPVLNPQKRTKKGRR